MKNFIRKMCIFGACLSIPIALQAKDWTEEHVQFSDDGRDWVLTHKNVTAHTSSIVFTLKDDASEFITIQRLTPFHASLKDFYRNFKEQIKRDPEERRFKAHLIALDDHSLLFESWLHNKTSAAEHSIYKAIKANNSIYIIHYTTKEIDKVEEVRNVWEKLIQDAQVLEHK